MNNGTNPGVSIAMWSGPRNISTAMMRAWENRDDCTVMDEPFYAPYLKETGIDHPMAEQIIAHHETDWDVVMKTVSDIPETGVVYQKHICTHLLAHVPLDWTSRMHNIFLVRDPAKMVASYSVKRQDSTPEDYGYKQLRSLFNTVKAASGELPLVVDSKRFLEKPAEYLEYLCKHIGIAFEQSMLAWPAGARDSDGIWEAHWYDAVKKSTGFAKPVEKKLELDASQQAVVDACIPDYEALARHALRL